MTESYFQKQVIDWAKAQNYHAIKVPAMVEFGIPDVLIFKGNRCVWLEIKTEDGKLRDSQKAWQNRHPNELVLTVKPSEFPDYKSVVKNILQDWS